LLGQPARQGLPEPRVPPDSAKKARRVIRAFRDLRVIKVLSVLSALRDSKAKKVKPGSWGRLEFLALPELRETQGRPGSKALQGLVRKVSKAIPESQVLPET
jgi:hypothetical protein